MDVRSLYTVLGALVIAPAALSAQMAPEAMLMPGDSLAINVWRSPELSGVFVVRPNGTIGDPFYGAVPVAALPLAEVERNVHDHVAAIEVSPRVVVDPYFRVSVAGEVRQPGLYGLGTGSTMMQAVLRAGGVNDRGRLNRVVLYRNGQRQVLDLTRPDPNMGGMEIRSGDQLVVSRRGDIFRNLIVPVATITGAIAAIVNAVDR